MHAKPKVPNTKPQKTGGFLSRRRIWDLAFGICDLRASCASSPLAFTSDATRRLALCTPDDGALGVCNALPQRNCGRFSRPSLLTGLKKNV
jgi:hypothetical protein